MCRGRWSTGPSAGPAMPKAAASMSSRATFWIWPRSSAHKYLQRNKKKAAYVAAFCWRSQQLERPGPVDLDFDPAVARAALVCLVVGHRAGHAAAGSFDLRGGDAVSRKILLHGVGASQREALVCPIGADVVGMAGNRDGIKAYVPELRREFPDLPLALRIQSRLAALDHTI